ARRHRRPAHRARATRSAGVPDGRPLGEPAPRDRAPGGAPGRPGRLRGPGFRRRGLSMSILDRPIPEIARLVSQGEVTAQEVTRLSLDRIAQRDGNLGAFLTVQAERALDEARAVDAKRARGERLGALAGVPIGIKDALCTRDTPTTAGSKILTRAPRPGEPSL